MSYAAAALFAETADAATASRLTALCQAEGIVDAVSVGLIDAEMADQLLGGEADELGEPLRRAIAKAKPLVSGWRTTLRVYGGFGGVLCLSSPLPRPYPAPASLLHPPVCMRPVPGRPAKRWAPLLRSCVPPVFSGFLPCGPLKEGASHPFPPPRPDPWRNGKRPG